MQPSLPWFVSAGSFDILHKGHRSVIRQASVLCEAFSSGPLFIIALSTNPDKKYLLSGEDKGCAIQAWVEEQRIKAKVYVIPCASQEEYEHEFEKAIGKPPADPQILLISGIKGEDIPGFQQRNRLHHRNTCLSNEKKVFVVANEDEGQFGSSTRIKEFLGGRTATVVEFQSAIDYLLSVDEIDRFTAALLPKYREELLSLYGM